MFTVRERSSVHTQVQVVGGEEDKSTSAKKNPVSTKINYEVVEDF